MLTAVQNYFTKSISRLVMASIVFVLLLPLGFLASSLPERSWNKVKDEVLDKHLLIAKSIEETINLYFASIQKSSLTFANTVNLTNINDQESIQGYLADFVRTLDDVVVVSYFSLDDYSKVIAIKNAFKPPVTNPNAVQKEPELKYLTFGNRHNTISTVSPAFRSSISGFPVVLVKTYLYDKKLNKRAILFAEVGLSYINKICTNINTPSQENCTIVDAKGRVISHPNQEWVDNIHNLSKMPVIQKIKRGESGVMGYQATADGGDVSGYQHIEKMGWGVIISQPKLDLDSPVQEVMINILKWLVLGIMLALIIAFFLVKQITKPINSLVLKSKEADIRSDNFNLGAIPKNSPLEIQELWVAISSLVSRLQKTNKKVIRMNYNLHKDIEKATEKLTATNKHLYAISSKDHLTKIANRRYFEDTVNKVITQRKGEKVSIILIDVDKFKFINDEYGHEAGDIALIHIAKLMRGCTRKGDLPARLGGDEFVIYLRNCGPDAVRKVAENLRNTVASTPIFWQGIQIDLTLSIGTISCVNNEKTTLTKLLKFADEAMYASKEKGRNKVTCYLENQQKREKAQVEISI